MTLLRGLALFTVAVVGAALLTLVAFVAGTMLADWLQA